MTYWNGALAMFLFLSALVAFGVHGIPSILIGIVALIACFAVLAGK